MSKKMKKTRVALLMSVISIVLCFSMLVGTTFAWFTDEASTAVNTIQAGTLKVDIVSMNGDSIVGEKIDFINAQYSNDILWEPGVTFATSGFAVKNVGNLSLKYKVVVSGLEGDSKLLDVIEFTVTTTNPWDSANVTEKDGIKTFDFDNATLATLDTEYELDPNAVGETLYLIGHMKEEAGNEYQGLSLDSVGITVYATQNTAEFDSFTDQYDKNATYSKWTGDSDTSWYVGQTEYTIKTASELAGLAELVNGGYTFKGCTITLGANIDLNNISWTPIGTSNNGFLGTFDGANYEIKNLNVSGTSGVGLFGFSNGTIKNVKVINANVEGNHWVGTILGYGYAGIENCTVENAVVVSEPIINADGTYDNGDKAGGIVGYICESGSNGYVKGCVVKNSKISAYRDFGSVIGTANAGEGDDGIEISKNTAENVTLTYIILPEDAYVVDDEVNSNVGLITGREIKIASTSAGNKAMNVLLPVIVNTADELIEAIENGGVVILTDDVSVTKVMEIAEDTVIVLNGDFDASAIEGNRPFHMTEGASLTIDAGNSTVTVGDYGLVNVPGDVKNVEIVLNGGNYVGETDNGAFIRLREGNDNINVVLNNVNYTDTSDDGYIINSYGAGEANVNIEINGGTYSANAGIQSKGNTIVKNAKIITNGFAFECNVGNTVIEDCEIKVNPGVTVSSAPAAGVAASALGTINVKNTTISGNMHAALECYTSGGTIIAENVDVTGAVCSNNKDNTPYYVYDSSERTVTITVDGKVVAEYVVE